VGLYTDKILEHARNPRQFGRIANPDLQFEELNPLCGDLIRVDIFGSIPAGSIKTLRAPAQVSPISNASSSPRFILRSCGVPVRATSSEASITWASTQPPIVTVPLRVLPSMTSILEPSFLGAVPSVATTVARAADEAFSRAFRIPLKISFMSRGERYVSEERPVIRRNNRSVDDLIAVKSKGIAFSG